MPQARAVASRGTTFVAFELRFRAMCSTECTLAVSSTWARAHFRASHPKRESVNAAWFGNFTILPISAHATCMQRPCKRIGAYSLQSTSLGAKRRIHDPVDRHLARCGKCRIDCGQISTHMRGRTHPASWRIDDFTEHAHPAG